MNTNVNFPAALGVLFFLGTCFVLAMAGLIALYGLIVRKFGRTFISLIAIFVVLGLYLGLMLVFSLAGSEKVLARGEEKHFCEIDCHLAYSVADVTKTKTLGVPPNQATAEGIYYVVTVKTRFDEDTISPKRGNGLLWPNGRVITIFDEQGRRYSLSEEGQRVLEISQGSGTPLTTPLRPGESYITELVFDLPLNVKNPTLLVNEELLPTRFIIGHENSFLHKQTKFELEPRAQQATQPADSYSPVRNAIKFFRNSAKVTLGVTRSLIKRWSRKHERICDAPMSKMAELLWR